VFSSCIYQMNMLTVEYKANHSLETSEAFSNVIQANPVSLILAIYTLFISIFMTGLCSFHLYLVFSGKTTNEQLKETFPVHSRHSKGAFRNFLSLFCSRSFKR
jgi:hypothetical protein